MLAKIISSAVNRRLSQPMNTKQFERIMMEPRTDESRSGATEGALVLTTQSRSGQNGFMAADEAGKRLCRLALIVSVPGPPCN